MSERSGRYEKIAFVKASGRDSRDREDRDRRDRDRDDRRDIEQRRGSRDSRDSRDRRDRERSFRDSKKYDKRDRSRSRETRRNRSKSRSQSPNYNRSGLLNRELMTKDGVVLKYSEPLDASPPLPYQLHMFKKTKEKEIHEVLNVNTQSCYLFGKESICDFKLAHDSISKQHVFLINQAVLQYRNSKPYIIDLESANGTRINGDKIPSSRYVELKHKDVIVFGYSSREYVFLNINSV